MKPGQSVLFPSIHGSTQNGAEGLHTYGALQPTVARQGTQRLFSGSHAGLAPPQFASLVHCTQRCVVTWHCVPSQSAELLQPEVHVLPEQ